MAILRRAITFSLLSSMALTSVAQNNYSEKDKKKLGEIAQRPEVQATIAKRWSEIQRNDMQYAYNVNKSIEMARLAPSVFADYRSKYGELYDNPALSQYVTVIGQRLVPKGSNNLYAFRILLDPVPRAESISTGTIYVSSGLVSLLDNEAQLSYVLAHEIAHIEKGHEYERVRNSVLEQKLGEEKEADVNKKKALFTAVTAVAGAAMGASLNGAGGALAGAALGATGGLIASNFIFRNKFEPTEWNTVEENEADQLGLKYMLDQQYDAREVPKLLARLDHQTTTDARIGLGFMGNSKRVKERISYMQGAIGGEYKGVIEERLRSGGLKGSTPQFALLMADLKRDNGIASLDYDLFAMAKDNLMDAVALRSDDSRAQGALGRLLALTAQTPEDRREAMSHTLLAIKYDEKRGAYPEPFLDAAVLMMSSDKTGDSDAKIADNLKSYVALYQRDHAGALPADVLVIYDYLTQSGDTSFFLPPSSSISTRATGAVAIQTSATGTAIPDAPTLVKMTMDATGSSVRMVPAVADAPATKPAVKRTSAAKH
ncbi:M48 family metalloprotease [Granulicella cerasi]|uniref:M48 family metalloprotease n=1 Tax=Granulicella cerasi TaxID=741063 RepID=A0ABW1ZBB3_9BACT|nr:M48 family metalloprotease [Granulicella cerasi]